MSFFGSSVASPKPKKESNEISATTGSQVEEIVNSLISNACDADAHVRGTIGNSLHHLGFRLPGLMVRSCNDWLVKNPKGAKDHRIILLDLVTNLIQEKREAITPELAQQCIELGMEEMVRDKDVIPDLQTSAASLIVSLASIRAPVIMDELLKRFEPGQIPHYFVLKTLGDLVAANFLETVPRLKEVFSRLIPILAMIKHDNMKWVISTATWQFCEGIQSYVANIDKGTDKSLQLTSFSSDLFPAFEIMFAKWSLSGERKLRIATTKAVCFMTAVFTPAQYDQQVAKMVPAVIGMIRKEKEALQLIQSLTVILEVGVRNHTTLLDPHLPHIMNTLHPLLCMQPDFSNSYAIKSFNETLRCFEALGRGFPEAVLSFILARIESKDVAIRMGSLSVIKHLVISIDKELNDKKGLLVAGVKPLVQFETNLIVKKSLAQLVISMASHEYLDLEGGDTLVEYLIRCCAYEDPQPVAGATPSPEVAGLLELRDICDNIMNLATTSIEVMQSVLWPYIFEVVVPAQYTGATSIVCKSLAFLACKRRESQAPDYLLDFDKLSNMPKPQQIIAKLLVMLNVPLKRPGLGMNILEALRGIGPILHPTVCDMWDEKLPKLAKYLEERSKTPAEFDSQAWEELVLRLLAETVRIANDDEWSMILADALAAHMEPLRNDPLLRKVSLKHLGIVLQKLSHKEYIKAKLEYMFQSTNHANEQEREGCAIGFGYCSTSHLDLVLEKINEHVQQHLYTQKSGGLSMFSFGKSSSTASTPVKDPVGVKNTLMLAYGHTAIFANPSLITSRVEVQIFNNIKPYVSTLKVPACKEAVCKMITLIGKAMHPSHLQTSFVFKARDELLKYTLDFLAGKEAEITTAVRISCAEATSALIHLDPTLGEEMEKLVVVNVSKFISLPSAAAGSPDEKVMPQLWEQLANVLAALLYQQTSVAELCKLIQNLEQFCSSAVDIQRERACECILHLLKKFIQFSTGDGAKPRSDFSFNQLGFALAMMIPRCTDPVAKIRKMSIESVGLMLYTDYLLKNSKGKEHVAPPPALKPLNTIRDKIEKSDINDQFAAVNELAKIICDMISEIEFPNCLLALLHGLADSQTDSANGTCVVLNGLIKIRGPELIAKIPELVEGLLTAMAGIANEQTLTGSLSAMRNLASHHLMPVLKELLEQPIPYSAHVAKSFQAIAKETLFLPCLNHLMNIMNNTRLHDEKPDRKHVINIPLTLPMNATAALSQILQGPDIYNSVLEQYATIFGTLLLRVGTSANTEPKPIPQGVGKDGKAVKTVTVAPVKQISEAVNIFASYSGEEPLKEALGDGKLEKLETAKYTEAISSLVSAMCIHHKEKMEALYDFLLPYIRGNYAEQRTVTAVVFAECINHCKEKPDLLQKLINSLIGSMSDPNVKIHVLTGLGNVGANGSDETNKYASTILDALTACLEDPNEELVMESMKGLSKTFEVVEELKVAPILVNLCHRIRPAFEKSSDEIRSASITMLGDLARFGKSNICADRFYEQVHLNIPSMLIHLNDDIPEVQKACKATLRKLSEVFRSPEISAALAKKYYESDGVMNYDAAMEEFCPLLISYYPDRLHGFLMAFVEYYKSESKMIRANAVFLTGLILGNLTPEKRSQININPPLVTHALISLLKDKAPQVRDRVAEALGLLHTYQEFST